MIPPKFTKSKISYEQLSVIAASFPGVRLSRVCWNRVTTLGAGTAEQPCLECDELDCIPGLVQILGQRGVRIVPLGYGSNFIGSDETLPDTVLLKLPERIASAGSGKVQVSGGTGLVKIIRFALKEGFGGAAALSGIPGTIGGAIVMNAGARGKTISEFVRTFDAVRLADGMRKTFSAEKLTWSYRSTSLSRDWLILQADLEFQPVDRDSEESLIREEKEKRKKNPQGRSAGSVFRNPGNGLFAGQLLEDASMKGQTSGAWHVPEQHANWIIGAGQGGSAADAANLIRRMRSEVWKKHHVLLEPEVFFVNQKEKETAMQL